MKVRLFFAWYDLWIGIYYDRDARILYVCPLPCMESGRYSDVAQTEQDRDVLMDANRSLAAQLAALTQAARVALESGEYECDFFTTGMAFDKLRAALSDPPEAAAQLFARLEKAEREHTYYAKRIFELEAQLARQAEALNAARELTREVSDGILETSVECIGRTNVEVIRRKRDAVLSGLAAIAPTAGETRKESEA